MVHLLARYTVVFFPIQSNFCSNQVSYFCNSVNSADLEAKDIHVQSYL